MTLSSFFSRLYYGAFIEKRWQVSVAVDPGTGSLAERFQIAIEGKDLRTVAFPRQYGFLADPFFYDDSTIVAEALHLRSGKGKIVAIESGKVVSLRSTIKTHLSYPCTIEDDGQTYVVPEMARGGSPQIFTLNGATLEVVAPLRIDSGALLDPTLVWHQGRLYLFANRADEGAGVLRLWSARGLFHRFEEHPSSPVRCDARGSRMGGKVIQDGGKLYRLGQDFRQSYGDGLLCYRIDCLNIVDYSECLVECISLNKCKGPHTLDVRDGKIVFDWYEEKFSPIAWARRLAGRFG